MKTNIINERESDKTISDAIAKGALVWAPLCSLTVCTIMSATATDPVKFTNLMVKSLIIVSPVCIGVEILLWEIKHKLLLKKLGYSKEPPPKFPHFTPPGAR